jgi:glycogen debranching enzyme
VLSQVDERLQREDGETLELGCNLHAAGAALPQGHRLLEEFRLDPWPVFRYRVWDAVLERSIFLPHGHDAVVLHYRQLEGPPLRLFLTPLFTARGEGELQRAGDDIGGVAQMIPGRVRFELRPGFPMVTLWHNASGFVPARAWYRGLHYREEGALEDAFAPGHLLGSLGAGHALHLVASIRDDLFRALAAEGRLGTPPASSLAGCVQALEAEARARRDQEEAAAAEGAAWVAHQVVKRRAAQAGREPPPYAPGTPAAPGDADDRVRAALARAADAFLVRRRNGYGLVAGYPETGAGSREALLALPGLLLATGRFDAARDTLAAYLPHLDDGLLPARLEDPTGPRAGAEASLWLVRACDLYVRHTDDQDFLRDAAFPALEGMMQYFRAGTRGGIGVDADGLLGEGLDAGARGAPPTRRRRVALNALWFHALAALAGMARRTGRVANAAFYTAWAREHQRAFNQSFWDEERGLCHAALVGDAPEGGLVPEAVLAASLSPPLLPPERAARLLAAIERELLLPHGLRGGPPAAAAGAGDAAHPWLLAHFAAACLRAGHSEPEALAGARARLEPLWARLDEAATLPEAFAATRPHRPLGAFAFAPSVGEALRVWVEELMPAAAEAATPSPS